MVHKVSPDLKKQKAPRQVTVVAALEAAVGKVLPHSGPSAEFRTVPAAKQSAVVDALRATLRSELEVPSLDVRKRAIAERLIAAAGTPEFYNEVAVINPRRANSWHRMARTQVTFNKAEASYDPLTRAYSESMRLTLHAAVIQHVLDPSLRGRESLYERFLQLHPTAFHENGAWLDNMQIPIQGAIAVTKTMPTTLWIVAPHIGGGVLIRDEAAVRAADWVRRARGEVLDGWVPA